MKKNTRQSQKYLILFESKALTIKSIYRKKVFKGKYNIYIRFNEKAERYTILTDNLKWTKDFRRGDLVTIHEGNGGYFSIERGNTVPKDGKIRYCEIYM
jgi:hypothetical protein